MSESVGHIGWSPDFREYEDIAAKKTILCRVVTKAEWTLREATCQSLREQSSRWEAQALEAGGRIAELEALVRELRDALRLMFAAIPDGWSVPLLYSNIVGQCKEVAARADKALSGEPQEEKP